MMHFNTRERVLFAVSLVVSGCFLSIYILTGHATRPLAMVESDSYAPLGVALYTHAVFSLSTTTPYIPEATHVPGYPLFLALVAAPFGSIIPALVVQILLFAVSGVLLYRLFEGVVSERIRFWAAFLFVAEPVTAYVAAQPLSEALFLFLLLCGLFLLRRAFERHQVLLFFGAGVFFGFAVLTRPIVTYAVPCVIGAVGLLLIRKHRGWLMRPLGALLAGIVLLVGPWVYRNYHSFGVATLSTKGPYTLYFYDAAQVLQYRTGLSPSSIHEILLARAHTQLSTTVSEQDLRSPLYASWLTHEAVTIIRDDPLLFARLYGTSMLTFFFSDGYRLVWSDLHEGAMVLPNITQAITTGQLSLLWLYIRQHPFEAGLLVLGLVFWVGVNVLAMVSLVGSRRISGKPWVLYVCAMAALYFALMTGPVAQARYRIVATPFLFMLASAGLAILHGRVTRPRSHAL